MRTDLTDRSRTRKLRRAGWLPVTFKIDYNLSKSLNYNRVYNSVLTCAQGKYKIVVHGLNNSITVYFEQKADYVFFKLQEEV